MHTQVDGQPLDLRLGSVVRYIRTARSRNSSGYFLGAAMVKGPLVSPI